MEKNLAFLDFFDLILMTITSSIAVARLVQYLATKFRIRRWDLDDAPKAIRLYWGLSINQQFYVRMIKLWALLAVVLFIMRDTHAFRLFAMCVVLAISWLIDARHLARVNQWFEQFKLVVPNRS